MIVITTCSCTCTYLNKKINKTIKPQLQECFTEGELPQLILLIKINFIEFTCKGYRHSAKKQDTEGKCHLYPCEAKHLPCADNLFHECQI